jgi:hypothetical protein
VLGAEVQVAFQTPNSVIPLVSPGKLKALAFSGERAFAKIFRADIRRSAEIMRAAKIEPE